MVIDDTKRVIENLKNKKDGYYLCTGGMEKDVFNPLKANPIFYDSESDESIYMYLHEHLGDWVPENFEEWKKYKVMLVENGTVVDCFTW